MRPTGSPGRVCLSDLQVSDGLFSLFFFFFAHCFLLSYISVTPAEGRSTGTCHERSCGACPGPWPSPAHHSPARPGFSVGRIAVSLVRQPGALGRWQGVRASGRGPLKSHLRGATPTRPLRWRLFWASPEAARLPFLEQQQSRPHAVASGKWGEGRFLLYFQSKHHGLWENFYTCTSRISQCGEIVHFLD